MDVDKADQLNVSTDPGQFQHVAESCRKRTLTVGPRSHEYDSKLRQKLDFVAEICLQHWYQATYTF